MSDFTTYEGKTVKSIAPISNYGSTIMAIRISFTDETFIEVRANSVSFDQYSSSPCLRFDTSD